MGLNPGLKDLTILSTRNGNDTILIQKKYINYNHILIKADECSADQEIPRLLHSVN
jgi:hypothetical protein